MGSPCGTEEEREREISRSLGTKFGRDFASPSREHAVGQLLAMAREERMVGSTRRARARMRAWVKVHTGAWREMCTEVHAASHSVGFEVEALDRRFSFRVETTDPLES